MSISRRDLLRGAAAWTAMPGLPALTAWAVERGGSLVFSPHGLSAADPDALFSRGKPDVCRGESLKWIGMPVGGLFCGQLYLGGDGRLWHWDLLSRPDGWDMQGLSSGKHYAQPMEPKSPIACSFGLEWIASGNSRGAATLDSAGFKDIEFRGEYPIGRVAYRDKQHPVQVDLEAFSPFIPLNVDDSSLPLTVLRYTVRNSGKSALRVRVLGSIENPVGKFSGHQDAIIRQNRTAELGVGRALVCGGKELPRPPQEEIREPILVSDFERRLYDGWAMEGTAFGKGPYRVDELPERYRGADPDGTGFVNSHNAHSGEDSGAADRHVGKLTSPAFTVRRRYLNFRIGGGNHPGKTCVNLIVDGKAARTATGKDSVQLHPVSFDVGEFEGKEARIEIVDNETGGWGHITVDTIVQADEPLDQIDVTRLEDFGELALAMLGQGVQVEDHQGVRGSASSALVSLKPGESHTFEVVVAWYFPNYGNVGGSFAEITDIRKLKKHYAKRFSGVEGVLAYYAKNRERLVGQTQTWVKTWYDSTLPFWFLDRTMISVDCLATATAHRFDNGRFYGWEGVYCCAGTCQHVWNYAQSSARLFPEFEQSMRSRVDFGLSWRQDGAIDYRGESGRQIAHDGLAGTILRTYREHTLAKDSKWLAAIWPRVKKTVGRLIQEDPNRDGMLEGEQYNTLDASWFGKISWISSLYLAALRAGAAMARDMGEPGVAAEWESIVAKGADTVTQETFNGEYYAMVRDPGHPHAPGYGPGCHVDQVLGDSWLHQVGLRPALPREKVRTALRALWRHNFVADAGAVMNAMQSQIKGGRWYAMPGEPGLLMTTWPRGGAKDAKGEGNPDWMVGYFNECMNGFEYQAAAHLIAEGMAAEGFAVVHALHQRYSPAKRNPYNEIECSDHYARSMASYGAFLTACGFAHHGPKGEMAFTPKVPGTNFRAAFTCATGWGTFDQKLSRGKLSANLTTHHGNLRLRRLTLTFAGKPKSVTVNGKPARFEASEGKVTVLLDGKPRTDLTVQVA